MRWISWGLSLCLPFSRQICMQSGLVEFDPGESPHPTSSLYDPPFCSYLLRWVSEVQFLAYTLCPRHQVLQMAVPNLNTRAKVLCPTIRTQSPISCPFVLARADPLLGTDHNYASLFRRELTTSLFLQGVSTSCFLPQSLDQDCSQLLYETATAAPCSYIHITHCSPCIIT